MEATTLGAAPARRAPAPAVGGSRPGSRATPMSGKPA